MEVFSAPAEHDSTTLATVVGDGKAAGFGHRVTIPAARLGPGRYVLRVQAQRSIDDAPVMREVPLQIR